MKNPMYNKYAQEYARVIQDNIYNANFERPSLLAMLPELKDLKVLDLACGPGAYAEYLLNAGAKVTAVDNSEEMVQIVKTKFGSKINCYLQDIGAGLPHEKDNSYDLVICPLAIHYIENLEVLFHDIARVLRDKGLFVFSTHHTLLDYQSSPSGNYFACELVEEKWDTIGKPVEVKFYRRSLSELFSYIFDAGLSITGFSEGCTTEKVGKISEERYKRLKSTPQFMFIKCQFTSNTP